MKARLALLVLALVTLVTACTEADRDPGVSSQPQGASLRVTIGTQEFPEGRIIGELWRQALAVNGYTVDLKKGIGSAEDLDRALRDGKIDGYVAYTGTVLSIVAGEEVSGLGPTETYEQLQAYYKRHDMVMSKMTPFQNKDAIATTNNYAAEHHLTTIGDLRKVGDFVLGARPDFGHLYLGLKGLQKVYGLTNAQFKPIALGAQYNALDHGDADAVNAFTTDPQLRSGKYTVLNDPKLLFGSQNVVMVVSEDKLDSIDADAFLHVINTVNSRLNKDEMVRMNAQVTNGRDEAEVAESFLRNAGLMEPLG